MSLVNVKCPNCGESIQIESERKIIFCSYCGNKVQIEENSQENKITDSSIELSNLYQNARRAKDAKDNKSALKYYDMILAKDPNSWEAVFFASYYRAVNCKISDIQSVAQSICNYEETVLDLINSSVVKEKQKDVFLDVYVRLSSLSTMLFNASKSYLDSIKGIQAQASYINEFIFNTASLADIMYVFGNLIIAKFGENYGFLAALSWKDGINIHKECVKFLEKKEGAIKLIENYVLKIQKYDSKYKKPEIETKIGCYIATSVYGSYNCPQVWTLRRFRDDTLDASWFGRCFIKIYYAISPTLVKWFGESAIFKGIFTPILDKMVKSLKDKGISDKPYNDKY